MSIARRRIGNNIPCLWEVSNLADVIESEGSDLSLYIITPSGKEIEVTDYTVDGDTISFTMYGQDNIEWGLGSYRVTLWNNKDTEYQRVVDSTLFVKLVSLSEHSATGSSDVEIGDTIELEDGSIYIATNICSQDVLDELTNLGLNVGTLTDLTTTDQSSLVAAINEVDANTDSKQDALQYYSEDSTYTAAIINAGGNASISAYGNGYVSLYGTQITQSISSSSNIAFNEDALTITSPSVTINGNEVATSSDIDGKQDTLTAGDNITIEDNVISADIDLSGYATTSDITGMVTSSTSGLVIEVVSELPSSPDENTIYIVQ